jgi:hypothetical protein
MFKQDRHSSSMRFKSSSPAISLVAKKIIFALFVLVGMASAQNQYYVASAGNDANDGSQARPWQTIQHAINSFTLGASGTVIHVAAGTYTSITNCSAYTNVALCIPVGRGGSSPTVRLRLQCDAQWSVPSSSGCLIRTSSPVANYMIEWDVNNLDISGFDVGNSATTIGGLQGVCNPSTAGACPTGNSVHITNMYVHDIAQTANDGRLGGPAIVGCPNTGAGIAVNQRHGGSVTDIQVIGNRVSHFGDTTITCQFAHGIYINTSNAKIQNNVVLDAAANGVQIYSAPCNEDFSNNIVVRSGANALQIAGGDVCSPAGTITVTNNILDGSRHNGVMVGTGGGGGCDTSHPILISNTVMSGNSGGNFSGTSSCSTPTNTFAEAPTTTFVSYLGNSVDDFHLKPSSIAIQTGTTQCVSGGIAPCVPAMTIEGEIRPNPVSIGAYDSTTDAQTLSAPTNLTAVVK